MDAKAQKIKTLMGLLKVLIVEDEHYSRKVDPHVADRDRRHQDLSKPADGASGLEAIQAHSPDVVLLDWEMPGMDGAEFMRRVRSPDNVHVSGRADHHAHRPWREVRASWKR